jgi:uncharacterized membrane protein HdeD (DUF308 family)
MALFGKKKQAEPEGFWSSLISGFLSTLFIGKLHGLFVELLLSAKEITDDYVKRVVRNLSLALSAVTGVLFLLSGIAQYIGSVYEHIPGAGYMIVGAVLLVLSMVWYLIPGER